MITKKIAIVALAALFPIAGCSSVPRTGTAGGEIAASKAVSLIVVNNNYADMDVYAIRGASRVRIGTVNGGAKSTFAVDPSLFATGELSLIADPIGGFGTARSGRLAVSAGDEVEFRIMPVIDQSTVFVRPPK